MSPFIGRAKSFLNINQNTIRWGVALGGSRAHGMHRLGETTGETMPSLGGTTSHDGTRNRAFRHSCRFFFPHSC